MIAVENVTKRFGSREALRAVTLRVAPGEAVALLGPNGSGKTTLLSLLSGVLAPDAGTVEVAGLPVPAKAREVKRRIGLVPQDQALYPRLTVEENLRFFGDLQNVPSTTLDDRVPRLIERVGLTERAGDRVGTLSGGMRQRVNLAAALVHDPPVLLLDEPTTGLDPEHRHQIWRLVEAERRPDRVVIVSTHSLEEARYLADRAVLLREGRIAQSFADREALRALEATYAPIPRRTPEGRDRA
ncbi:MAG TPA: ABC transporter ATP-binding protein [Candidatus Thermoplasmatota archaeon]|nr:ABC transporter ATP-binding protein [Candidatus Thermoplasmatota archaeon]